MLFLGWSRSCLNINLMYIFRGSTSIHGEVINFIPGLHSARRPLLDVIAFLLKHLSARFIGNPLSSDILVMNTLSDICLRLSWRIDSSFWPPYLFGAICFVQSSASFCDKLIVPGDLITDCDNWLHRQDILI